MSGITQRFQYRLDHAASTTSTLDALQDRIVQLEKEIEKLKSDNDQLKALREKAVANAEALKRKHHVQRQKIEQIAEERDSALQKLEMLEVTIRGCFSGDRPGVSFFRSTLSENRVEPKQPQSLSHRSHLRVWERPNGQTLAFRGRGPKRNRQWERVSGESRFTRREEARCDLGPHRQCLQSRSTWRNKGQHEA